MPPLDDSYARYLEASPGRRPLTASPGRRPLTASPGPAAQSMQSLFEAAVPPGQPITGEELGRQMGPDPSVPYVRPGSPWAGRMLGGGVAPPDQPQATLPASPIPPSQPQPQVFQSTGMAPSWPQLPPPTFQSPQIALGGFTGGTGQTPQLRPQTPPAPSQAFPQSNASTIYPARDNAALQDFLRGASPMPQGAGQNMAFPASMAANPPPGYHREGDYYMPNSDNPQQDARLSAAARMGPAPAWNSPERASYDARLARAIGQQQDAGLALDLTTSSPTAGLRAYLHGQGIRETLNRRNAGAMTPEEQNAATNAQRANDETWSRTPEGRRARVEEMALGAYLNQPRGPGVTPRPLSAFTTDLRHLEQSGMLGGATAPASAPGAAVPQSRYGAANASAEPVFSSIQDSLDSIRSGMPASENTPGAFLARLNRQMPVGFFEANAPAITAYIQDRFGRAPYDEAAAGVRTYMGAPIARRQGMVGDNNLLGGIARSITALRGAMGNTSWNDDLEGRAMLQQYLSRGVRR